jgi:uncharacterized protein (TIGR02301 family)
VIRLLALRMRSAQNRYMLRIRALAVALCLASTIQCAAAQDQAPDDPQAQPSAEAPAAPTELPPPIYEANLLRLAEILGSLSFLRDLCGNKDGAEWRQEMSALLAAEQPGPQRMRSLIARFNHGFETFNAVYRSCTPSAELAIRRYLAEGQALAGDVRSRYSQ